MATEEPPYQVLKSDGDIELRSYESYSIAEVSVEGEFESAGSQGFRSLANYIFGGNEGQNKIAMTAPVSMQKKGTDHYVVNFTMPRSYTLATLPAPQDKKVSLREIPAHKVAVYRYSGTWSQSRFEERKSLLQDWIKKNSLKETGEAIFARYNAPWVPWFLRRNEVWIPVE